MNIALLGLRASGKTTVGRILAQRLRRPFIDTDEQIIQQAGMSIREIFLAEGEAGFRRRERMVIRVDLPEDRAVIALVEAVFLLWAGLAAHLLWSGGVTQGRSATASAMQSCPPPPI